MLRLQLSVLTIRIIAEDVSVLPMKAGALRLNDAFRFQSAARVLMDAGNVFLSSLDIPGAKFPKLAKQSTLIVPMTATAVETAFAELPDSPGVKIKRLALLFLNAALLMITAEIAPSSSLASLGAQLQILAPPFPLLVPMTLTFAEAANARELLIPVGALLNSNVFQFLPVVIPTTIAVTA